MTTDATYDELSPEYYDAFLHPTCANFRHASRFVLKHWGPLLAVGGEWICEVGAGSSLLCEEFDRVRAPLNRLLLTDISSSMLAWSQEWKDKGAHLVVSEARALPLPSNSMGAVVSVLGDCYDTQGLWVEAFRVVRSGGIVLLTTPSYEWASAFRGEADSKRWTAEFVTREGLLVGVSSFVRPVDEETTLIESVGFAVKETIGIPLSELQFSTLSPKLSDVLRGSDPVVIGYLAMKP